MGRSPGVSYLKAKVFARIEYLVFRGDNLALIKIRGLVVTVCTALCTYHRTTKKKGRRLSLCMHSPSRIERDAHVF